MQSLSCSLKCHFIVGLLNKIPNNVHTLLGSWNTLFASCFTFLWHCVLCTCDDFFDVLYPHPLPTMFSKLEVKLKGPIRSGPVIFDKMCEIGRGMCLYPFLPPGFFHFLFTSRKKSVGWYFSVMGLVGRYPFTQWPRQSSSGLQKCHLIQILAFSRSFLSSFSIKKSSFSSAGTIQLVWSWFPGDARQVSSE